MTTYLQQAICVIRQWLGWDDAPTSFRAEGASSRPGWLLGMPAELALQAAPAQRRRSAPEGRRQVVSGKPCQR